MGTIVAMIGAGFLALAVTLLRGLWQAGAVVLGGLLMGFGVWIQRRKDVEFSGAGTDDRDKDYLPGYIGGDPRPWLEKHGKSHSSESEATPHDD